MTQLIPFDRRFGRRAETVRRALKSDLAVDCFNDASVCLMFQNRLVVRCLGVQDLLVAIQVSGTHRLYGLPSR